MRPNWRRLRRMLIKDRLIRWLLRRNHPDIGPCSGPSCDICEALEARAE